MESALVSCWRREDVCSEPSVIACEPRSLNDLPDEILLEILSYFGLEDLCLIIAKVCEKWNVLAKDIILWKKLPYSCDSTSDISVIEKVLTAAPALHTLIIHERKDVADILEFLFDKHCGLKKLTLDCCILGEDSTGLLTNIVALYPDLEGLSLEDCHPHPSAAYCLIPRLKKLSELNLPYCEVKTVRLIADSCQHLKKLNLYTVVWISDDDVIHVIKKLGKQLTALALYGSSLTDVTYSYLKNCPRLQDLEVFDCKNMTDRGLLEGIGSLHELKHLSLDMCDQLTTPALSTFLHRPSMTSMVSLNLSVCSLNDEGLEGIAERCMHLNELALDYCKVTNVGVSMVVSHCNQLRVLKLGNLRHITGECLALVPSHLPHLRELCLDWSNNVCDKYVQEIMAALPELKVTKPLGSIGGAMRYKREPTFRCGTGRAECLSEVYRDRSNRRRRLQLL